MAAIVTRSRCTCSWMFAVLDCSVWLPPAGSGVHMFNLDPTFGEFVMTKRNWTLPKVPKRIYSCNTGNVQK